MLMIMVPPVFRMSGKNFISIVFYAMAWRSEEHTSELQSQSNLVCRLLLEKKKKKNSIRTRSWEKAHAESSDVCTSDGNAPLLRAASASVSSASREVVCVDTSSDVILHDS